MTKKKVINKGIVPQYYVEDDHEPIIPKELFYRVQEELARRASMNKSAVIRKKNQKSKFSSEYALTGLLLCGDCGQEYRRVTWSRNGKKKIVWRCSNRLTNGTKHCKKSETLEEGVLNRAVMEAINRITRGDGDFVGAFRQNVIRVIGSYNGEQESDEYDEKIKEKESLFFDILEDILGICKQEKYSPVEPAINRAIKYALNQTPINYDLMIKMLNKLDVKLLSDKPFVNNEGREFESFKERYFRLKVRALFETKQYKVCVECANQALATPLKWHYNALQWIKYYRGCALLELKEYNRYMKGMFSFVGFNTKWLEFHNVERPAGKTKWSFKSLFSYAFKGIFSFSSTPITMAGVIGGILILIACFISLYSIFIHHLSYLTSLVLFLSGIQLVFVAILGQYCSSCYFESKQRPIYIIKNTNKKM